MKLLGIVFVLISTGGIGFLCASELRRRKNQLEEQLALLKLMLGDIRYMKATLPEAIGKALRRHTGVYLDFLRETEEKLTNSPGIELSKIWSEAVKKGLHTSSLTKEDKENLIAFGDSICSLDRESLIASFEQYSEELNQEIHRIQEVIAPKTKLYRSIGILVGIFIVVILI